MELSTALDMMEGKSSTIIFSFAEKGSHTLLTSRERFACGGTGGGLLLVLAATFLSWLINEGFLAWWRRRGFSDEDWRVVSTFIPDWCSICG